MKQVPLDTQLINQLFSIPRDQPAKSANRDSLSEGHPSCAHGPCQTSSSVLPSWAEEAKVLLHGAAGVEFALLDASIEEVRLVQGLSPELSVQVLTCCRNFIRATSQLPTIQMYCIGKRATLAKLPENYGRLFTEAGYLGFWSTSEKACFFYLAPFFDSESSLQRVVVHELGHGFMDLLCAPYQMPFAISEGFARAMEVRLLRDRVYEVPLLPRNWPVPNGNCCPIWAKRWSIQSILAMESLRTVPDRSQCESAYWLLVFLGALSLTRPMLSGFLDRLRMDQVGHSEFVDWLSTMTGDSPQALERSFFDFLCCERKAGAESGTGPNTTVG